MISTKKLLYKIVNAIDGSNFGNAVTIPRTLSNSNKTATFNYTFPADGYLYISTVATDMSYLQSWELALNTVLTVPFVFVSPFTQNITLFVKKGMTLNGSMQFSSDAELAKVVTTFYPFA